jgi:type III pantothenate kinase
MNLVIDVGNTRIKCALFENNSIITVFVILKNELQKKILEILENYNSISNVTISSVGKLEKKDFNFIKKDLFFVTNEIQFPFINRYETPKTLGIDRMVLSTGSVLQYPNQNRLIIDAGTCVTYDFVSSKNEYLGGAISPGIRLRYESLHNYTAKLPLLTIENPENLIGNSTFESIHSGVINGISNEIDGFIDQYKKQFSNFIIILTGGDADFLAKRLKNIIFANSNFLLESLNQIYQYNFKND